MHNHRFPFAVLPFAPDDSDAELYEMMTIDRSAGARAARHPYEEITERVYSIRPGVPYAIYAPLEICHSVETRRHHMSLSAADVSQAPWREDRNTRESLRLATARDPRAAQEIATCSRRHGGA